MTAMKPTVSVLSSHSRLMVREARRRWSERDIVPQAWRMGAGFPDKVGLP